MFLVVMQRKGELYRYSFYQGKTILIYIELSSILLVETVEYYRTRPVELLHAIEKNQSVTT